MHLTRVGTFVVAAVAISAVVVALLAVGRLAAIGSEDIPTTAELESMALSPGWFPLLLLCAGLLQLALQFYRYHDWWERSARSSSTGRRLSPAQGALRLTFPLLSIVTAPALLRELEGSARRRRPHGSRSVAPKGSFLWWSSWSGLQALACILLLSDPPLIAEQYMMRSLLIAVASALLLVVCLSFLRLMRLHAGRSDPSVGLDTGSSPFGGEKGEELPSSADW